MSKGKIIKELEDQLEECEVSNENMDEASWEEKDGVLITGNQAKEIIEILGDRKK